ncbi:MAG: hypothetical protein HQ518_29440 [Rhodopirellula sp.]|nr:hypothetical protein [Rhodopirellula sp.]
MDHLPKALLTASLLAAVWRAAGPVPTGRSDSVGPVPTGRSDRTEDQTDGRWEPDLPETYLSEAQQIAERGPMPLFLADVHLHRSRLCGTSLLRILQQGELPTEQSRESIKHDLAEAKRLIDKHGYGRRREELADAELALRPWISPPSSAS